MSDPHYTQDEHEVRDGREPFAMVTESAYAKWREPGTSLTPACLSVYLALIFRAHNSTKRCFPSVGTIAEDAGVSKRTAIRAIELLHEHGLLYVQPRNIGNRQTSNLYIICHVQKCHGEGDIFDGGEGDKNDTPPVTKTAPQLTRYIEPNPEGPDSVAPKRKKATPPATAIDDEWYPASPAITKWAEQEGFAEWEWKAEVRQFVDYHTAKGNRMSDWQRAFYTWMRNSRRFSNGNGKGQQRKVEYYDRHGNFTVAGAAAHARGEI